jgi:tetrahydrodipicolinate N-succinyltransferase
VSINGNVVVSENSFVGSNATTKESIVIDGFINAGSLVK